MGDGDGDGGGGDGGDGDGHDDRQVHLRRFIWPRVKGTRLVFTCLSD